MAQVIFAHVTDKGFIPASPHDYQIMQDNYANGVQVRLNVTQPRSVRENRFYWVSLQNLIDAGADFPSAEVMHQAIKLELGYVTPVKTMSSGVHFIPSSTSFERMDQSEFKRFMKQADELLLRTYGVGFDELKKGRAA
jgi:hypothetical protein